MESTQTLERFSVVIGLGNAAMQDAEDVAFALRALADRLMRDDFEGPPNVLDSNGQTVGEWAVR